jgi:hypothetical protein
MSIVTRYFVDAEGNYLGAYAVKTEAELPAGGIEVKDPPADARQKWTGKKWGPAPPPLDPDPAQKLAAFLAANPDVAALIG